MERAVVIFREFSSKRYPGQLSILRNYSNRSERCAPDERPYTLRLLWNGSSRSIELSKLMKESSGKFTWFGGDVGELLMDSQKTADRSIPWEALPGFIRGSSI